MKEIWTNTKAEYHGEMVDFPEMKAWPKPVQRPHPPILVGGALPEDCAAYRSLRRRIGADRRPWARWPHRPGPVAISTDAKGGRARPAIRADHALWCDRRRRRLARYRDQGIARVVAMLPSADSDSILPTLDRWAEFIRRAG
jgi:hypothetical protein